MDDEFCMKSVRMLNGHNFNIWKGQMYQVFIQLDLLDLIEGISSRPTDATKNDDIKAWDKLNAKAIIAITSTINGEQYELVASCSTAKQI